MDRNIQKLGIYLLAAFLAFGSTAASVGRCQTTNDGSLYGSTNVNPNSYNTNYAVPSSPTTPMTSQRPASWPGGPGRQDSPPTSTVPQQYPSTTNPYAPTTNAVNNASVPQNSLVSYPNTGTGSPNSPGSYQNYPATATGFGMQPNNPGGGFAPVPGYAGGGAGGDNPYQIESNLELCEGMLILARVGSQGIFAYEVNGDVPDYITAMKKNLKPEQLKEIPPEYWDTIKTNKQVIKILLNRRVENTLILQDAMREIQSEQVAHLAKVIDREFEKTMPKYLKEYQVQSEKELEDKLRAEGGSIERLKKQFHDQAIIGEWIRKQTKKDEEPTYGEMQKYYKAHIEDFVTSEPKARWEELTLRYTKYPSQEAAYGEIAQLGNAILSGTVSFADAAKNKSDGLTSSQGGSRDWITQGSLREEEVDKAIFSLPIGQLSPIIVGKSGVFIVRVLDRTDRKITPFEEAGAQVIEKIKKEREKLQIEAYINSLKAKTPVWTIFDEEKKEDRTTEKLYGSRR